MQWLHVQEESIMGNVRILFVSFSIHIYIFLERISCWSTKRVLVMKHHKFVLSFPCKYTYILNVALVSVKITQMCYYLGFMFSNQSREYTCWTCFLFFLEHSFIVGEECIIQYINTFIHNATLHVIQWGSLPF